MPGSWSDFLKLRSGPAPPPSSEAGAVRVYADANGALRSVQSDGTDAPIGGGGLPDPITDSVNIEVTDDSASTADLYVKLPSAPTKPALRIETNAGEGVLEVDNPGGTGLVFTPAAGGNSSHFTFGDTGQLSLKDSTGKEYLAYGSGRLDLDPDNGQVDVHNGYLKLAASSEPADAELTFNGCFILYVDGNDLKAKAKIGGSFVHLTIGTFA